MSSDKESKVICLLIVAGMVFRVIMMVSHFTHWDDIGVANYVIQLLQITNGNEIDIAKGFADMWTYGPLQILITQKLINENMSYMFNIIMGRLPSLVCNILFVITIYKVLCKVRPDEKSGKILAICIISLSWENIIYSSQMEPYSMGILFSAVTVYLIIQEFYDDWKKTLVASLLLTLGCYAQYQMFIFVFATYVAVFFCNIKNKRSLIRVVFAGGVNLAATLPLIFYLFNTGKISQGINSWNIGNDSMFRYQCIDNIHAAEKVKYTFEFFLRNIFLCFKYIFLSDSFEYIANILTYVLLICAVLGVFYIHKSKEYIIFAFFHDLIAIVMFVLILRGSITLGPSRHILIMEPVWITLIYFGLIYLVNMKKVKAYYKKTVSIITVVVIVLFALAIPGEIATRRNFISEIYIRNLVKEYNPQFVFAESSLNDLYLFNIEGFFNNSMSLGSGWLQNSDIHIKPQTNDTIILMSKNHSMDNIKVSDNYMRQQLEERIDYFKLDKKWTDFNDYTIVYRKEIQTDAEVEYARKYYWNYSNGLYLYVLKHN